MVLFHVAMRNDAAHRPGYQPELMGETMGVFAKMEQAAADMGVTIVGSWSALPDHVDYLIADAPDNMRLAFFLGTANPYGEVETETSAVTPLSDVLGAAQEMAEQSG